MSNATSAVPPDTTTLPRVPLQVLRPPTEPGLYVNEVFLSLQGEGRHMGLPTVFLRTMGCPLRCTWCDTTYSFHEGGWMPWDRLLGTVQSYDVQRLCLTGGEPLIQRDAWRLVRHLLQAGWEVSIETAGAIVCDEASRIANELGDNARARLTLSLDVKCPSSGEERTWKEANLAHVTKDDQIKFIIADDQDYVYARDWVRAHPDIQADVWFHPEGGIAGEPLRILAERILADGLPVRLGVQLHKLLWGTRRGV